MFQNGKPKLKKDENSMKKGGEFGSTSHVEQGAANRLGDEVGGIWKFVQFWKSLSNN